MQKILRHEEIYFFDFAIAVGGAGATVQLLVSAGTCRLPALSRPTASIPIRPRLGSIWDKMGSQPERSDIKC